MKESELTIYEITGVQNTPSKISTHPHPLLRLAHRYEFKSSQRRAAMSDMDTSDIAVDMASSPSRSVDVSFLLFFRTMVVYGQEGWISSLAHPISHSLLRRACRIVIFDDD